jgi:hypothetical protein
MTATQTIRAAALTATLLLAAACSDGATSPAPVPSITISAPIGAVFEGDVVVLRAVVRDAAGREIPGAPITWSVSDATVAEVATDGTVTTLKPGVARVTARSGTATAAHDLAIARLMVQQVTVLPVSLTLAQGDITPVGIRVQGEGGRDVQGRLVTITSDDPSIASIDASGRVRAVSPGVTTVRAIADGVTGTSRVEVTASDAVLVLSRLGGARLPLLVGADSVEVGGVLEYHEVYVETGRLLLTGAAQPRYEVEVRYAEYNVVTVGGQRSLQLRLTWREYDRGLVHFDARGDLTMVSEYVIPLSHTASAVSGGFEVRFRIPGEDTVLDLFYRRQPE